MNIRSEPLDHCEACGTALYEGDMAYSYDDGPTFCWQHAPTWSDLKREQDQLIAEGLFDDLFDDGPEAAEGARQEVLKRIAAGDGDKHVGAPL